jgi:hypothetical protein
VSSALGSGLQLRNGLGTLRLIISAEKVVSLPRQRGRIGIFVQAVPSQCSEAIPSRNVPRLSVL